MVGFPPQISGFTVIRWKVIVDISCPDSLYKIYQNWAFVLAEFGLETIRISPIHVVKDIASCNPFLMLSSLQPYVALKVVTKTLVFAGAGNSAR
jgi:hypothetical protein